MIATTGDPEPELLGRPRRRARRARRSRSRSCRSACSRSARHRRLVRCRRADRGVGAAGLRRARRREALEKVAFCMRLDEPDPVAAWREHLARLRERGAALDALKPDALRYRGPGTDLTVGLLPGARWFSGSGFTKPASSTSRTCRPKRSSRRPTGAAPRGRSVEHAARALRPDRPRPGAHVQGRPDRQRRGRDRRGSHPRPARDDRERRPARRARARDRRSRVGQTGTLFYDTLFDENATCHIAYGTGLPVRRSTASRRPSGVNVSQTHVDFMVGGPELEIDAVLADGTGCRSSGTRSGSSHDAAERLERYAELAVRVGANVQEGQEVFLYTIPEHADVARALTRQCYRAGASYVNVRYDDAHVRHAMIELGPDSALTYSPEWMQQLTREMAGNALLATTGDPEPELLADLDGDASAGRCRSRSRRSAGSSTPTTASTGAGRRSERGLGAAGFRRARRRAALGARRHCFRLDEEDPVAAWREHLARLDARGEGAHGLKPDALHYRGPGTDLTVGLLPTPVGERRLQTPAASTTSRTCRPRRSSRRPTRGAPRGRSARRCRSPSPAS